MAGCLQGEVCKTFTGERQQPMPSARSKYQLSKNAIEIIKLQAENQVSPTLTAQVISKPSFEVLRLSSYTPAMDKKMMRHLRAACEEHSTLVGKK